MTKLLVETDTTSPVSLHENTFFDIFWYSFLKNVLRGMNNNLKFESYREFYVNTYKTSEQKVGQPKKLQLKII